MGKRNVYAGLSADPCAEGILRYQDQLEECRLHHESLDERLERINRIALKQMHVQIEFTLTDKLNSRRKPSLAGQRVVDIKEHSKPSLL